MQTKKTKLPIAYIHARSIFCTFRRHTRRNNSRTSVKLNACAFARSSCFLVLIHTVFRNTTEWRRRSTWTVLRGSRQSLWSARLDNHVSGVKGWFLCALTYTEVPGRRNNETPQDPTKLYSGMSCLKPGHRLNWPEFFVLFLQQPGKCRDSASK